MESITLDVINVMRYDRCRVIRSFACDETRRLFERQAIQKIPADAQRAALRKLKILDAAVTLADLRIPPGNRLEKLKGRREV